MSARTIERQQPEQHKPQEQHGQTETEEQAQDKEQHKLLVSLTDQMLKEWVL